MLFDYIFYRLYKFFETRGDTPQTSASLIVSLIQFFTLLDLLFIGKFIHDFPIPSKYYFLPIIIGLGIINWYRYERNFSIDTFNKSWENEHPKTKVRNGWLIGLYLGISFLIPVSYGILKYNLNII
jgi:hypothetical protein